jgi:hypothetical protein
MSDPAGEFDDERSGDGYDDDIRRSQSAWSFVSEEASTASVGARRGDLAPGEWDRRFGECRERPYFVGSLRLLVNRPAGSHPEKTDSSLS